MCIGKPPTTEPPLVNPGPVHIGTYGCRHPFQQSDNPLAPPLLAHPIAGDKMYGFKNQAIPKCLNRQFLHSAYLKIKLPNNQIKEFKSELTEDLKICLQKLKHFSRRN